MHPLRTRSTHDRFATALVAYAANKDEGDDGVDFVIPEDLTALDDEALSSLHDDAVGHFDTLFGDGTGLSVEDVESLASLTDGIESLNAEIDARAAAATERAEAAAALAARVRPADQASANTNIDEAGQATPAVDADGYLLGPDGQQVIGEDGAPILAAEATPEQEQSTQEVVTASGRREVRVPVRSRTRHRPRPEGPARSMTDVVLAADVPGFSVGEGMDWPAVGRAVDRRLTTYNASQYAQAHATGRHLKEQQGIAMLRKPLDEDLTIRSTDIDHVQTILRRAMDESRLPGGSLVASGGWCAPSETLYDLCELESDDGLISVPEVGVARGGISWTTGPSWSSLFANAGFTYTEQQDIDGTYGVDENGVGDGSAGTKPCYRVECPPFQEERLGVDGICIQAGLLQSRGYPEVIARTVRGGLVAHNHRMSATIINAIAAGSTAVTMPANVGAVAPLLDAIELQTEHYRYAQRMSRNATLEATFPYWVRGVVRSDLARRLGLAEFDVPDARIDGWFRSRGINPQYVYDYQPLVGAAGTFVAWPSTVKFLLYAAGTWVKGGADIITLDTLYDSTLLAENDYTALFTEEGYLVAKMCEDSRVVTVNICPDGSTHAGVLIDCNGTATAATP